MQDKTNQIMKLFLEAQDRLVLQASDLSLETIASMVKKAAIDIAPHYQRRERWHQEKQSALIESFILNIPVPPVYLAEDDYLRRQDLSYSKDSFKFGDTEVSLRFLDQRKGNKWASQIEGKRRASRCGNNRIALLNWTMKACLSNDQALVQRDQNQSPTEWSFPAAD